MSSSSRGTVVGMSRSRSRSRSGSSSSNNDITTFISKHKVDFFNSIKDQMIRMKGTPPPNGQPRPDVYFRNIFSDKLEHYLIVKRIISPEKPGVNYSKQYFNYKKNNKDQLDKYYDEYNLFELNEESKYGGGKNKRTRRKAHGAKRKAPSAKRNARKTKRKSIKRKSTY